ncbi:terminase small subunit [Sulfitobacter sp. EhC04]|uniref:DNA-packaging protein n=1 Tax=Sulfitobacter sp. EhC04 TaxID=1849168 RepID=UPI0007F3593E|nr:DNA-packaging protein [Sulfitobacter sp. EhC04]OAN71102.1 terminase small subunit [Sulfitobacter sp. EhC04]
MSDRDENGRFAMGNRFWEARSSHGAKPKFNNPDDLWGACLEYFDWNHENPLYADQLVTFQGSASHEPIAKMRAMTIAGLCQFIDIDETTWREWRTSRPDLSPVITRAESVIYRQKFEGASADLLNGSIIARDLGLADKREHTSPDGSMTPKVNVNMTPQEAAEAYAATLHSNKG